MEYAVLLYGEEAGEADATPEQVAAVFAAHDRFAQAVFAGGGAVVGGAELEPSSAARSLRWTADAVEAVDGPFAETTEQLGGLYVIEAPDLDAVLEWVRLLPHDSEVRPTTTPDMPDDPPSDGTAADAPSGADPAADGAAGDGPAAGFHAVALLYGDEASWAAASEAERAEVYAVHGQFAQAVHEAGGAVLGGRELAHSDTATSLRCSDDDWAISDGPFAESVEQLTGWYELSAPDAATMESLLRLLSGGTTEIRPVAG